MDFTIKTYKNLLSSIVDCRIKFYSINEYFTKSEKEIVLLRHDVDLLPYNSLQFARIQEEFCIKGTYYFRIISKSFDVEIIHKIADLGHEIGYHYETMDTCNGDVDKAYDEFCRNLEKFRELYPVTTICMHGSPRSKFDNKAIWDKYDYKALGIIGEPYYDVNFDEVFYLTDTGRRWDGWKYSVRDKLPQQEKWIKEGLVFHSTQDIINTINANKFPDKVMFTFHPQRWTDSPIPWMKEFAFQNAKNIVKYFLIKLNP